MSNQEVLTADQSFFNALIAANVPELDILLTDNFVLVDVFSGSVIDKPSFMEVLAAGQLVFEAVDAIESTVRIHGSTAIVVGRTAMSGNFDGAPFSVKSRYTHVFIEQGGAWRFVSAQGTRIVE